MSSSFETTSMLYFLLIILGTVFTLIVFFTIMVIFVYMIIKNVKGISASSQLSSNNMDNMMHQQAHDNAIRMHQQAHNNAMNMHNQAHETHIRINNDFMNHHM